MSYTVFNGFKVPKSFYNIYKELRIVFLQILKLVSDKIV